MPIRVICPKCLTRFKVGDQHAGKKGACPKCKGVIEIPTSDDDVVIHAPEMEAGAVDAKGRNVLKPITRKETKFHANTALIIGGAVTLCIAIAFLLGQNAGELGKSLVYIMGAAACLLGPPLAWAGYSFLRNDEADAYQGVDLMIRSAACGLAYALLWGLYMWLGYHFFGLTPGGKSQLEIAHAAILLAPSLAIGAFAAYASFDLEPLTGFFHCALYFSATILLRVVMQLAILPGLGALS